MLHKVNHSILRYANCWEDADLLLRALDPGEDAIILSIGSAGDNCFSLLSRNPHRLVCVDINDTQLSLVRLKKAAFQALNYQAFLEFLGFVAGDPLKHFHKLEELLSKEDRRFWEERKGLIQKGLIYQGKFERYLLFFQRKLLPLMHSQKHVGKLLEHKPQADQQQFYEAKWNNLRWRIFTRLFFSRKVLGWGRDPEFLRQVRGNVSEQIKSRINEHLSNTACQKNLFLKYMLQGHFNGVLPHYARAESFEAIRKNIEKLEVRNATVEEFTSEEKFSHLNLSNIFEYLDEKSFSANAEALYNLAQPGGKIAYWNLLVKRELAETFPNKFVNTGYENTSCDMGFFYAGFNLNHKK